MIRPYQNRRAAPGLLRIRFHLAIFLCLVWAAAILLRLFYLQVLQHDQYVDRAEKQRSSVVTLYPERGPILDRKGTQLAISVAAESVYAAPEEMKNPRADFEAIARILPVKADELLHQSNGRSFLWIARKVPPEEAERVRKLRLSGIYFTEESRRYYPNKETAAHLLGFVGMDNKGLSGVEYQYEKVVCGVPGKLPALRDAKRRLLLPNNRFIPAAGRTLQLTIDSTIQHIAEVELKAAVEEQGARGGSVIIMNPYNGEILALANEPTFNPNIYQKFSPNYWRNRAIQDYYEPGSTFKPVVATAAIDLHLAEADDPFDCQYGSISVAGHIMKDHKPFGTLTLKQVIQKSSNVGAIKVGMLVGPESLFKYATSFGFGAKTGIDLPAEAPGLVRSPSQWSAISIGAFSIGQELGVTPLQILRMMSSFANGGYLLMPHCVAKISDSSGQMKETVFADPQPLPVKHSTLTTIRDFLEAVVATGGSGHLAEIPGYSVAGKTGTAQVIGPSGSYADGGYIASFVGYAPAKEPVFSMITVLYGPKKEYYGGRVAAPLFRKIGQQVLKYLEVPPDQVPESPVLQVKSAFPRATQKDRFPEVLETVAYAPPEQHHKLVTAKDDGMAYGLVMPSLYGRTLGETLELLKGTKAEYRILGSGTVVNQWPIPGAVLNSDDLCIITLQNSNQTLPVANLNGTRK